MLENTHIFALMNRAVCCYKYIVIPYGEKKKREVTGEVHWGHIKNKDLAPSDFPLFRRQLNDPQRLP
jgi:hypothetical protein